MEWFENLYFVIELAHVVDVFPILPYPILNVFKNLSRSGIKKKWNSADLECI